MFRTALFRTAARRVAQSTTTPSTTCSTPKRFNSTTPSQSPFTKPAQQSQAAAAEGSSRPLPWEDTELLGKGAAQPKAPATGGPNQMTGEINGPKGPEPTRYGDFERAGRCYDF